MFIDAAGVDVHYVERGAEQGPDVPTAVLLHGFTADHRLMLEPFEAVFAERPAWRRIYLDLPGMGATRAPDWLRSTDDVFRVVRIAVDALVPGPFVAIGQSYGGYLARGLVAAAPGRAQGLALSCPVIEPEHVRREIPVHRVLVREPGLVARVGAEVLDADIGVVQTEETWRRTLAEAAPGLEAADPAVIERLQAAYAGTFPVEPRPFDGPTLFLLGRQDSVTGYRDAWQVLESYPHASLAVLDWAGHNLQIEQPRLFEALVAEWLDRVEEARAHG